MQTVLSCTLLMFCFTTLALAQSSSWRRELLNMMIANGDITRDCVREQGGGVEAINVDPVNLNEDITPEYMVSGNGSCCGGARRCNTWIYQKNRGGYSKIFGGRDGLQGDVTVLKTRTKGYRDIRSTMYSGPDAFHAIDKWDGRRYKLWKNLKPTRPGF